MLIIKHAMIFLSLRELSKRIVDELRLAGFESHKKIFFSFPATERNVPHGVPRPVLDLLLLLTSGLLSDTEVDSVLIDWPREPGEQDGGGLAARISLTLKNGKAGFNFRRFADRYSLVQHLEKVRGKIVSVTAAGFVLSFPLSRREVPLRQPPCVENVLAGLDDLQLGRELIKGFLSHTELLLRELEEKISAGDSEEVRRIAHSLKGSALNILAGELRNMTLELEERARNGILENGHDYLEKIRRECTAISEYFEKGRVKRSYDKKDSLRG